MRLCFALVSSIILGAASFGFGYLACAQMPARMPAQMTQIAQVERPQISWMQSSARPRWGGGQ